MKLFFILSGFLALGNPMISHAQVIEISQSAGISTDSILTVEEKFRQDSIMWEKELATVTVTGTRSQFRLKNGGIVARISGTSLEKEPTVTDVLSKLPGMTKNKDGKPQAFIGGSPEIYINDRKVQDYSVVENLPVTQIKEVKVIHHPGAEYGNNVGCVLLITTKKNLEGLAIVANSGVIVDSYLSNYHDIDLTYNHGKMTYYGKVGYANTQGKWKETDLATNYLNVNNGTSDNPQYETINYISSSTVDCNHSYNDRFYWSAGADLALSQKHTVGVKYDGYDIHQPMPFLMTSYAKTNDHVDDNVIGNNKFVYYDWQHHVNAFYLGQLGEKWKLSFFGDFVGLHTEQGQFVDEQSELEESKKFYLLPQSDGTVWGVKARANYTLNDKQSLMFGSEYNYVKSESRADYTPIDMGISTHSITKEKHAAAFAEYSIDFSPFSVRLGLRYEHVDSRLKYLPTESGEAGMNAPIHRKYDNVYPSLLLTHQAGRFSQSISYRSSETRPSFQQLNTGTVYMNRYIRQYGNSELEPAKRHELQYQASYRDFFLQASYCYVKNYITSIIVPNEDDPQTGYFTWTNIDHCWNWGAFIGYRHRWGFYEPQIQTGIQQGFLKVMSMGEMKSFHDPYYIFNVFNGFHLPKGWYMNLSFNYRSSGTYDFLTVCSVHNFNFQLYKSFMKERLSLSLNVNDIFNTVHSKTDGTYGHVRFQQQRCEDTRCVQLSLTYRFNQAKKQYRGENTTQDAVGRMGGK